MKLTAPIKALELSRRLFEQRGRPLLQQFNLLNVCAAGGANHHCPGEYAEESTLVPTAQVLADTAKKYLS